MKRKQLVIGAAVLVAAALILWWRSRGEAPAPPPAAAPATASAPSSSPEVPSLDRVEAEDPSQHPEQLAIARQLEDLGTTFQDNAAMIEKVKETKAIYIEQMAHPPWSRPLDGSLPHLTAPNRAVKVGQPFAADEDKRELRADFELDRWFIGPGESATGALTVTRVDEPGASFVPDKVTGRIEYYDAEKKTNVVGGELRFAREGDRYVTQVTPAEHPALVALGRAPDAVVVARVEVGRFFKEFTVRFRYAIEPPFRVLGIVDDRIEDNFLQVTLDVEVTHPSQTVVMAALYDETGTKPIVGYDRHFFPEAAGRQQLTIAFHGKPIHDAGISGRYRIKGLRGQVQKIGEGIDDQYWMHPDEPPLLTQHRYSSASFSAADWQSPEKDAQIKRYDDLISRIQGTSELPPIPPAPPPPTTPPPTGIPTR